MRQRRVLMQLSERLELPEEALAGAAKLTVTAGRHLRIENHRGLLEYGAERIVVNTGEQTVSIMGARLTLTAMTRQEVLIEGEIQAVEWM